MHYYDSENTEKGIFSYNCKSMLKAKEVDGDITKFGYDAYNVLNQIIKPNADELDFNFDMLGRLREYETSNRESTFDYDGIKRLGDFDDSNDEWHRYHWCKQHLLGYKDDSDTYYFLTEPDGSVEVIFTHAGTTVNRLEYDFLGKLRNQTTTPQVDLLWRGGFLLPEIGNIYFDQNSKEFYDSELGKQLYENSRIDVADFDLIEPIQYDNPIILMNLALVLGGAALIAAVILSGALTCTYCGAKREQLRRYEQSPHWGDGSWRAHYIACLRVVNTCNELGIPSCDLY